MDLINKILVKSNLIHRYPILMSLHIDLQNQE